MTCILQIPLLYQSTRQADCISDVLTHGNYPVAHRICHDPMSSLMTDTISLKVQLMEPTEHLPLNVAQSEHSLCTPLAT